jgi:hypothetical protein
MIWGVLAHNNTVLSRKIHEKCLKIHRVSAKMLFSQNKQLLGKDTLMETVCHKQLIFESLFSKKVVADFAGGRITADATGLLLRELDQRLLLALIVAFSPPQNAIEEGSRPGPVR